MVARTTMAATATAGALRTSRRDAPTTSIRRLAPKVQRLVLGLFISDKAYECIGRPVAWNEWLNQAARHVDRSSKRNTSSVSPSAASRWGSDALRNQRGCAKSFKREPGKTLLTF